MYHSKEEIKSVSHAQARVIAGKGGKGLYARQRVKDMDLAKQLNVLDKEEKVLRMELNEVKKNILRTASQTSLFRASSSASLESLDGLSESFNGSLGASLNGAFYNDDRPQSPSKPSRHQPILSSTKGQLYAKYNDGSIDNLQNLKSYMSRYGGSTEPLKTQRSNSSSNLARSRSNLFSQTLNGENTPPSLASPPTSRPLSRLGSKSQLSATSSSDCDHKTLGEVIKRADPLGVGLPSENGLKLLKALLMYDPASRISAAEALKSPFFMELDVEASLGSHKAEHTSHDDDENDMVEDIIDANALAKKVRGDLI
eukprot:Nk52_evm21s1705 gene=Nk52_evmTU21s1705